MSSRQWNTISSSGHKHFDEYYGCERKEVSSSFLDSTWKCDCALWMGKNKIKIQRVDYIIVFARHERVLHFIRLPLSLFICRDLSYYHFRQVDGRVFTPPLEYEPRTQWLRRRSRVHDLPYAPGFSILSTIVVVCDIRAIHVCGFRWNVIHLSV